jgi:hypothetical protein
LPQLKLGGEATTEALQFVKDSLARIIAVVLIAVSAIIEIVTALFKLFLRFK